MKQTVVVCLLVLLGTLSLSNYATGQQRKNRDYQSISSALTTSLSLQFPVSSKAIMGVGYGNYYRKYYGYHQFNAFWLKNVRNYYFGGDIDFQGYRSPGFKYNSFANLSYNLYPSLFGGFIKNGEKGLAAIQGQYGLYKYAGGRGSIHSFEVKSGFLIHLYRPEVHPVISLGASLALRNRRYFGNDYDYLNDYYAFFTDIDVRINAVYQYSPRHTLALGFGGNLFNYKTRYSSGGSSGALSIQPTTISQSVFSIAYAYCIPSSRYTSNSKKGQTAQSLLPWSNTFLFRGFN
jgi:hypothetical protein